MLETAVQLESDPPETVTSDSTKSVAASERVKVSVALLPALKESSSSVMAMVGRMLSTLTVISAELVSAESVASIVRMCCELLS